MPLDTLILAILKKGDTYGYALTLIIKEIFSCSESTLYPVLRRLQKDGYLAFYDSPHSGRNRRYYTLTSLGDSRLAEKTAEWEEYKQKADTILYGGGANEQK